MSTKIGTMSHSLPNSIPQYASGQNGQNSNSFLLDKQNHSQGTGTGFYREYKVQVDTKLGQVQPQQQGNSNLSSTNNISSTGQERIGISVGSWSSPITSLLRYGSDILRSSAERSP